MSTSYTTITLLLLAVFCLIACGDKMKDDQLPDPPDERLLVRVERDGMINSELDYDANGRLIELRSFYNQNPQPDNIRRFTYTADDVLLQTMDFDSDGNQIALLDYVVNNGRIHSIDQIQIQDSNSTLTNFEYVYNHSCGRSVQYKTENGQRWTDIMYEYTDSLCSFNTLYFSPVGDLTFKVETKVDDAPQGYVFESMPFLSPFHGNIIQRIRHRNGVQIDSANSYNALLTYEDEYLMRSDLTYLDGDTRVIEYFYE